MIKKTKPSDHRDMGQLSGDAPMRNVQPINGPNMDDGADLEQSAPSVGVVGRLLGFMKSGLHKAKNGVKDTFKSVGSVTNKAFDDASNYLHVSKKILTSFTIVALSLGCGTGVLAMNNHHFLQRLYLEEDIDENNCAEDIEKMKSSGSELGDVSGLADEYAAKAWAIGKAIGMSDEQAAGMLGNMDRESGLDPTTIEAIYDEPFNIDGPKKKAARDDVCAYVTTALRQTYINSGWTVPAHTTKAGCHMAAGSGGSMPLNIAAYEGASGHFAPGLGIFQFTGPNADALVQYAKSGSHDWWDFDVQMAFSIDETGGYGRAGWVHEWVAGTKPSSPEDAATQWNEHFEGQTAFSSEKGKLARKWYDKFKGQKGDSTYAQSVIDLANAIQGGATATKIAKAIDECETAKSNYDNADLAKAAVAYAYETKEQGNGNNGTELYQFVHDAVYPGDNDKIYQSCDRGVTTAIRWSGSDDDCPRGNTDVLDNHFQTRTDRWQKVGEFGKDVKYEDLQPGDILNTNGARRIAANPKYDCGHIVIYVGEEAVKEKFPNSSATFVSASLDERSPGCEHYYAGMFEGEGYYVYRNIKKTENPLYVNVAAGKNLKDR